MNKMTSAPCYYTSSSCIPASGRRTREDTSPRVHPNSSPYSHSALSQPSTEKQVRSIFKKPDRDTRITQEERSTAPPQVPAPSTTTLPAKPDIILPPVCCTHVPIKPKGLPPVLVTNVAKPVHLTMDAEARKTAQEAMHQRVHLLPNQKDLKDIIGKQTKGS